MFQTNENFQKNHERGKNMMFSTEKMYTFLKGFSSGANMPETKKALVFARKMHENQKRSDGQPYIIHPLTMACEAVSLGIKDDNVIATILLHDIIEDCNVSINDLPVSDEIKKSVLYMTFKVEEGQDKEVQKQLYYKHILEDKSACICKLLDRCHNVSSMAGTFTIERLEKYIKETKIYVYPLLRSAKDTYPEYSDQIFVLKYHITSIIDTIEETLHAYSCSKKDNN